MKPSTGDPGLAAKEAEWLPRLAPHLPLPVPTPVAVGRPGFGYPWPWAVTRWLPGSVATVGDLGASVPAALELAGFLSALRSIEVPPGVPTGRPLSDRDRATRSAIDELSEVFDAAALTRVWAAALNAPAWDRPPVWFHGDFHTGNLLTVGGHLSAVIDFGGLGAGDPASDLQIAYSLLDPAPRAAFRAAVGLDDAAWARGRGWTLTGGLLAYRAYAATDPRVATQTTRQITAALADAEKSCPRQGPSDSRAVNAGKISASFRQGPAVIFPCHKRVELTVSAFRFVWLLCGAALRRHPMHGFARIPYPHRKEDDR